MELKAYAMPDGGGGYYDGPIPTQELKVIWSSSTEMLVEVEDTLVTHILYVRRD